MDLAWFAVVTGEPVTTPYVLLLASLLLPVLGWLCSITSLSAWSFWMLLRSLRRTMPYIQATTTTALFYA